MRFLDECPWDRLHALRETCPNICLQVLLYFIHIEIIHLFGIFDL
jgi:pyruvate carboxylase